MKRIQNLISTKMSILKILIPAMILLISSFAEGQIPNEYQKFLAGVDTTGLYWQADKSPEFQGGQSALINFYSEYFYYPLTSQENGAQGTVDVLFIVERDGSLSNIVATDSIDGLLEKAAVDFVEKMPKWVPGEKNGKTVRVLNVQHIKFKLE